MSLRKRIWFAALCLALGWVAPGLAPAALADDLTVKPTPSIDEEFVQLAREIPGFGGFYYEEGQAKAYLVDTAKAASLDGLRRLEDKVGGAIEVKAGRYDWLQLTAWRDKVETVLRDPAVHYVDIDESVNRIRLGIDRSAPDKAVARVRLQKGLDLQGIPRDAVIVEEREPARFAVNVDQGVRPVAGSLQITWLTSPTTVGVCTLGYNACDAAGRLGFLTNSHCSLAQGGLPVPTVYHQHLPNLRIGVEVNDPAYPLCPSPPFPAGTRCRFSDSLFAVYDNGVPRAIATIYRTTGPGSIIIDPVNPAFTVTAVAAAALPAGTTAHKIGRTTGWSSGLVTATCANIQVGTIIQRCQEVVIAAVGSGDSGSPVFTWSGAGNAITAAGLLWGQGVNGLGQTVFFYSRLGQIAGDLGALNLGC